MTPQIKNKKILIYFFLFLIFTTFNNQNLNANYFKIDKISILGLEENDKLLLKDSLNLLQNDNIFFLNKNEIANKINANPTVENFSVFKIYPSSLSLKIDKTIFLAQIKSDSNNLILGSNGKLIQIDEIEKNLPYIFGDFNIKNFFELKKAIDETNFDYGKIKNLFFYKSGRWDIETNDGLIIKLPKLNLKDSLDFFQNFLSNNPDNQIKKVDLRQNNLLIINE
tara:strand:- start:495 stop:1166 length:672 start_codon:yes stop_codon:yes gene_type:complete